MERFFFARNDALESMMMELLLGLIDFSPRIFVMVVFFISSFLMSLSIEESFSSLMIGKYLKFLRKS